MTIRDVGRTDRPGRPRRSPYDDPHGFAETAAASRAAARPSSRRPNYAVMAWKDRTRRERRERMVARWQAPWAHFLDWIEGHGKGSF